MAIALSACLPAEAWDDHSVGGLKTFSVPAIALAMWIAGSFLTLMVKSSDPGEGGLSQGHHFCLGAGIILLAIGVVLQVLLLFAYL